MRHPIPALAVACLLLAGCGSIPGTGPKGEFVAMTVNCGPASCPPVNVEIRFYPVGLCYWLSDDINVTGPTNITWALTGPADKKFTFASGERGVVVTPDQYPFVTNTGKTFTRNDPYASISDAQIDFHVLSGTTECVAWFHGANPYIRNR